MAPQPGSGWITCKWNLFYPIASQGRMCYTEEEKEADCVAKVMTKSELRRKRAWFRALSGLADFFASIASFIIILLCIALLTSLFAWLKDDINATLKSIESVAINAIVNPDEIIY